MLAIVLPVTNIIAMHTCHELKGPNQKCSCLHCRKDEQYMRAHTSHQSCYGGPDCCTDIPWMSSCFCRSLCFTHDRRLQAQEATRISQRPDTTVQYIVQAHKRSAICKCIADAFGHHETSGISVPLWCLSYAGYAHYFYKSKQVKYQPYSCTLTNRRAVHTD